MQKEYAEYLLNKVKKDYNLISKDFSRTRWFVWDETKFLFNDYLKQTDKILDMGCGNGRYYELAKIKNADYIGIDSSEKLIEEAQGKYPEARFLHANALNLPFPDCCFEKVYSIAVFHQIPSKELRMKFLKEANRVLKKDGLLIITVWKFHQIKEYMLLFKYIFLRLTGKSKMDFKDFLEPWGKMTDRYYHWFSKMELARYLKNSGFKIKEIGIVKNKRGNRQNIYAIAEKVPIA